MKRSYSVWLVGILAVAMLAASSVGVVAADPKKQADAGKAISATGRIIKIQPADGRLTLRTTEGGELELSLDARSQLKVGNQDARLSQFKEGSRVRIRYERIDSKNRVVEMRDAPVTAEELRQELREALEAAKAYTFQQKEEYQKRLEPVLHDLDDRIEILKEQAKGAGSEAQKRYAEAMKQLQREREVVRERLAKVRAAAPGAWEEIKSGMSTAWEDMRKAFQRAHDRMKESNPSDKP